MVKVIYIAGHTRSGSTLLDRLLGQIEGMFSIGEARGAWDVFAENWLCECGKPVMLCPFWSEVVRQAFGKATKIDFEKIKALQLSVSRIRYLPLLSFPTLRSARYKRQYAEYLCYLKKFYEAIAKVAGSKIIVDSSKNPSHALLLNSIPDIEINIIHLVRDSRAVAFSWQRKRKRPEVTSGNAYQKTYNPFISALQWSWANIATEWLKFFVHSYVRIRYEDLVIAPRKTIKKIFYHFDLGDPKLDFFDNDQLVKLKPGHTIFGNPMRMQHGEIEIKPDAEWQIRMKRSHRAIVTAVTSPLLLRYGYIPRKGGGQ